MTFLGKMLAVLLLVGSVTAATWSIVFTTQKQPWMGVAKKDPSTPFVPNPITTIADSIKAADGQHDAAAGRLMFAQAETVLGEIRKPIRREYYQRQYSQVRQGTPENKEFSVLGQVEYPKPGERMIYVDRDPGQLSNLGANGQLIVNPTQTAIKTRAGLELKPIQEYERSIPLADKLALEQNSLQTEAIAAMKDLTHEIVGVGETKGLRTLAIEQTKLFGIVDGELSYLNTIARNRQVDRLIFSRRLTSMEAREKELREAIGRGATVSDK